MIAAVLIVAVVKLVCPLAYRELIHEASQRYQLDFYLVAALIRVESSFNPRAISRVGACGLMQLMPETARYVAEANGIEFLPHRLFEPEYNIGLGCMYLRDLIVRYQGDERSALAAYNAGPQVVDTWLKGRGTYLDMGEIQFRETREFVRKVELYRKVYRVVYFLPLRLGSILWKGGV